ncbi:hypothetical protein QL093DRAFT_2087568 [Fusarium oxysporum]|nr:hypothetical protein QL093DRAFT_2087568 [Fusarium oxysporum]
MNMTSTPPATPKRQRNNAASDNVAQNVLCGIEEKSREIRFHGHNVKRLATKLQARARRALQDPRIDDDDLKDSWEALLLLIESKTAAASKDKAHKAQVWSFSAALRSNEPSQRKHGSTCTSETGSMTSTIASRLVKSLSSTSTVKK